MSSQRTAEQVAQESLEMMARMTLKPEDNIHQDLLDGLES